MTIRVLVADDQALVRGSFRLLVDTAPDLTSVGEAATGMQAVELARREKPDVVLMDIRMPGMDGIEATRQITASQQTAAVRVLILTTFDLDEYVFAALRAGASGFLLKDTPPADLMAAIRIVMAGDALLAPAVTRRLIAEFTRYHQPPQHHDGALDQITEREREVLALIGTGLSNTEISSHLHVSMSTTKTHVGRLLAKLAARDRAQLVIAAYDTGLVRPPQLVQHTEGRRHRPTPKHAVLHGRWRDWPPWPSHATMIAPYKIAPVMAACAHADAVSLTEDTVRAGTQAPSARPPGTFANTHKRNSGRRVSGDERPARDTERAVFVRSVFALSVTEGES